MKNSTKTKAQWSIAAIAVAGLILFLIGPRSAAGKPTPVKTRPDQVQIDNFSFAPRTLTVRAGTKVTWINKDDVPHTVASAEKKFPSRAIDTDEHYEFTFTAPGTYKYFCSLHPHMTGTIVVTESD